ncbi:uncharacterized protein BDR25DRAFT_371555 [Lindgomyces ingoldianus]|uniref:Uncharacterized protein n=1 Tax=Lindgomyces ingoldianus TaxID=673940 RepID=A0ACB6QSQ7_9PLEO|nr:uncharacterized protein BDR25DRAFT_371555 [Lindgomyces ingoldianus]KAF2469598.1 hypothetical protein BDR25DRAFT_371555 [Lindgomyces ingoldianus]
MTCNQNYNSSSWFVPDSTRPDFNSSYTLGSWADLSWWGNIPYSSKQSELWRLLLAWFSDTDADSAFSQGHTFEITSTQGWVFVYGTTRNPSWRIHPNGTNTNGDSCGNTELGMAWEISRDIDISSNQKFKIFAMNLTNPEDIATVTSPGFSLLPSSASSTTSSIPATTSSSSSTSQMSSTLTTTLITSLFTSSAPLRTTPTSLSRGAKAGIGFSCSLLASLILLGIVFFMRWQWKQKAHKGAPSAFERADIDGTAADKQIPEAGGWEIHEMDEQRIVREME